MCRAVCQRQLRFFSSIAVEHEDENFKSIALVVLQWLDMAYFCPQFDVVKAGWGQMLKFNILTHKCHPHLRVIPCVLSHWTSKSVQASNVYVGRRTKNKNSHKTVGPILHSIVTIFEMASVCHLGFVMKSWFCIRELYLRFLTLC